MMDFIFWKHLFYTLFILCYDSHSFPITSLFQDEIEVKKDTERQDEIKAMKQAWEAAEPGRAAKVWRWNRMKGKGRERREGKVVKGREEKGAEGNASKLRERNWKEGKELKGREGKGMHWSLTKSNRIETELNHIEWNWNSIIRYDNIVLFNRPDKADKSS